MRNNALKFLLIYLLFVVVFILMKPAFMLLYPEGIPFADWGAVILHGFAMDLCVAGYLTVIPGLLLTLQLLFSSSTRLAKFSTVALNIYIIVIAIVIGALFTLDFGLYGSWHFRLDATPFFYIVTSPKSAMASLEWWHYPLAILSMAVIASIVYLPYRLWIAPFHTGQTSPSDKLRRLFAPLGMLILTGALFLPIRGSLTVSTMNPSRAYFSPNQQLNHAALNPLFSLLYSLSHQTNFDRQYRFMPTDEANRILANLLYHPENQPSSDISISSDFSDSADPFDKLGPDSSSADHPDVVLIILESFSAHLLPSLGGEEIAPGLDSLAHEGVSFTNFYASSFRTDRGLAAILSSFPAPPTTSLLKYVEKFENLPSLPGELKRQGGYALNYFYGGDANFTNMQAYLVSMGFDHIISDRDFPLSEKESKWGAHDDVVFRRALSDLNAPPSAADKSADNGRRSPSFTVVQTSSSHEPFEVPFRSPRFPSDSEDDRRRNAFAFADSCLFSFVDALRQRPEWSNTLVVITGDHYGCYPQNLSPAPLRHHIPFVLLGGWKGLRIPASIREKTAMQTDIAATLLNLLGYDASRLKYSRNLLSPSVRPAAIFTEPNLVGVVTPADTIVYNPDADAIIYPTDRKVDPTPARAFLRSLYATLDSLGRK